MKLTETGSVSSLDQVFNLKMIKPVEDFKEFPWPHDEIIHPNIVPNPSYKIELSTTLVQFLDTPVNTLSEPKYAYITNVGNSPVLIKGTDVTGSFFMFPAIQTNLEPEQTASMKILFYPKSLNSFTGCIFINSNSINSVEFVKLSGQGI